MIVILWSDLSVDEVRIGHARPNDLGKTCYSDRSNVIKSMRGLRRHIALCVILPGLFVWALGSAAEAQPRQEGGNDSRKEVQPLDRLLPAIRRSHPGEFSDVHGPTYGPSGDPHYHLKWITPDGDIIWFDADAQSGQVLRTSPGRDSFDGP